MKSNSTRKNNNLTEFLNRHYYSKPNGKITHTKIADPKLDIKGGSYDIQKENLNEFYDAYHKTVFIDKQKSYLTEKQLDDNGPILIDIDLRYDYSVVERVHTNDHIQDLIVLYLDELKSILKFDGSTRFPIYIFEKPTVNRLEDKEITKDGIHIIIGISLDRKTQSYLREQIIKNIQDIWDIPKINTWESIFDDAITKGTSNWQLYGSMKPGNQAYELTQYFMNTIDEDDGEIMTKELSINEIISPEKLKDNLFKLSAQYDKHPKYEYTDQYIKILEDKQNKKIRVQSKSNIKLLPKEEEEDLSSIQFEDITNFEILQKLINKMLSELTFKEYNIREAHEYTQVLPERFYEPGSHTLNTQVALALKHTNERLFLSWVMLRSKASDFEYSTIPDLYKRWNSYFREKENGVTIRSIIYWAKEYNREGYEKVKNDTCEAQIDYTIYNPTDYDLANILHYMFKDKYVCSDIKTKTWYIFKNHRWILDRGQGLRLAISTDMYSIYDNKYNKLVEEAMNMDSTDSKQESLQKKIKKINEVKTLLKKTSDKNNIMREAMGIFFDHDFSRLIDTNPWLICFKNGVVDLKQKIFRAGLPYDYITKCTNINYQEYNEETNKDTSAEVIDFMNKIFQDPSLNQYMWDHLSSVLIGENINQTFNIYHGRGSNGKSMLTDLMFMTLGEYAGTVPVSLITEKRPGIGGTSSEIIQLKGLRYAVMAEPKKGDKMNEGIMKQLTGDSTISGRALYCESETFMIQFHLVVCTNTLFEMSSHDDGTWRRIRVCDFETKFYDPEDCNQEKVNALIKNKTYKYMVQKNKYLKDKMKTWVEVFAGMLVKRAFENQGKVHNCLAIKERTDEYKLNSNYIEKFVTVHIDSDPEKNDKKLKIKDVHEDFKIWYKDHAPGEKAIKIDDLKNYITDLFYPPNKKGEWVGLYMKNISMKEDEDDDEEETDIQKAFKGYN
jgi:P4 family phage/plasmid primase-like protien